MSNDSPNSPTGDVDRHTHAVLEFSAEPDAARVDVCVRGTCAVLKGAVRSWAEHEDAERAALSIPGVTTVDNQLALLVTGKPATR